MAGTINLGGVTLASHDGADINLQSTNVTFPAGHIIQTITDTHSPSSATTVTTTSNDYLGADLQCTITPTATGNKLVITAFIPDTYNNAQSARGMHAGFAYDANFSSGNGTTIGPRAAIATHQNYMGTSDTLLTNLQYSIVVVVGTQAPSAGSASIIRPIFQAVGGDVQINTNSNNGIGVCTMMVMEIQQ